MPFELSEEQELIRRTAREFAEKSVQPAADAMDRNARFPREVQQGLAELGFWGLAAPAEHGGAGMDLVSLVVAVEEVARRSGSAAAVLLAHNVALKALPAPWVAKGASGEAIVTLSLGEGPLASSLRGSEALAGTARLFPLAGEATAALAPHTAGGWVVVPREAPGVAWVPEGTLGLRGAQLGQVVLRDARLARATGDLSVPLSLGLAALATGLGQAAVEESVKFAKDRIQFGKPIATYEGIRARLAEMAALTDAGRALTLQAAALADRGEPAARLAAEAKTVATEAASAGTRLGIKLHGGSGFLKDFPAERLNRDARMLPLLGGDTAAQRVLAARGLLG
jgi:butyryl-CoA dehydrogenase